MNINSTTPDKQSFLQLLGHIDRPPKKIFYTGILPAERIPTVAIVGTRKPTAYGREVTYQFAKELAERGVVIVSGLALGVDGIAHTAACDAGGATVAVLPCGLPRIYPSSHRGLAERIVATGGALLTEYGADQTISYQSNFLERNRIVAGLSDALLITEAAVRSGTLSTATHALAQGKEVFVIPGNITSPMSTGCNALLKQGALVATCANDIVERIAPQLLTHQARLTLGNNSTEVAILIQLQAGVRDGDEIQRRTGLSSTVISTSLTMLEIRGSIRSLGANQWTLT